MTIISNDSELLACEIYSKRHQLITFNPRMDSDIDRIPNNVLCIDTTNIAQSINRLHDVLIGIPYKIVINHKKEISMTKPANYRYFDLFNKRYYIDSNSTTGSVIVIEPDKVIISHTKLTPKADRCKPIVKRSSKIKRQICEGLTENLATIDLSQYKPKYVEPKSYNRSTELR